MSLLDSMLPILEASGFQRLVFEDFYDVLASLVRQIVIPEEGGTVLTPVILLEAIQSPEGKQFSSAQRQFDVLTFFESEQLHRCFPPPHNFCNHPHGYGGVCAIPF